MCVSVLAIWNVWRCFVFFCFFGRWCALTEMNAPWSSVSWAWATDYLPFLFLTCKKLSGNLTFSFFLYVGWVSSTGGLGQVFNETAWKTQNSFRLVIDKSEWKENIPDHLATSQFFCHDLCRSIVGFAGAPVPSVHLTKGGILSGSCLFNQPYSFWKLIFADKASIHLFSFLWAYRIHLDSERIFLKPPAITWNGS